MGTRQDNFLSDFKAAFNTHFKEEVIWHSGQKHGNYASLPSLTDLRRNGISQITQRFELGDLRTTLRGKTLVVEYDGANPSMPNLLKYWPYTRGELSIQPTHPVVLCHFSNWGSWGSHRDLWQWLMGRIQADSECKVNFVGRQFDHGHNDMVLRRQAIAQALNWIAQKCSDS